MTMKINDNGTDRDMTQTEIANHETWVSEIEANKQAQADAKAIKEIARTAVLDKLGLTADEVAALLS
jgi:hypothetical protein